MNPKIITSILLAITFITMIYMNPKKEDSKTKTLETQVLEKDSTDILDLQVKSELPEIEKPESDSFICSVFDSTLVKISGIITNPIGNEVSFLYRDTSYVTTIDKKGKFNISFSLDSVADYIDFKHGVETTSMYIKRGDEVNLRINTNRFDETIKYKNSPASSFLAKKYLLKEREDFYGDFFYKSTKDEYYSYIDRFKQKLLNSLKKVKDAIFQEKERKAIEEDLSYFTSQKNRFGEVPKDQANFYIKSRKIQMSGKYPLREGIESLNREEYDRMLKEYESFILNMLNKIQDSSFIANQTRTLDRTVKYYKNRKIAVDNLPGVGESSIDFSYPDINGEQISLSDFKGRYVYVDVWATWCGPCVYEIPYLKQLEEDYREFNIVFMSVSIDVEEKKQVWLDMIEKEEMKGVQLISTDGFKSQICKDYAINGIPRFMLFDTEGNVVDLDAPRPSSNKIKDIFTKLLE